ncbi:hypothetical protein EON63_20180 [archaeon]|nr:MAG: hypothetical protein EON63_20180 [archaeon]
MVSTMAAKSFKRVYATKMRKTRFFTDVPLPRPTPSNNNANIIITRTSSAYPLAHPRTSRDECVEHIREVRVQWENGILEELKAITFESKRPFLLTRENGAKSPHIDQNPVSAPVQTNNSASGGGGGGGDSGKEDTVKFLFDSEDLMETILAVKNRNLKDTVLHRQVGLMQVSFSALSMAEVGGRYMELSSAYSQIGRAYTCTHTHHHAYK